MSLTIIRNKVITPDYIAKHPRKVRGGWVFSYPALDLWRYKRESRNKALWEWTKYGALALASIVGGVPVGVGALVNVGPVLMPDMSYKTSGGFGFTTQLIDAAGEYIGLVFLAPKTGSIRGFGTSISAVAGAPTADFQLETVSATTGSPTGTLFGTNTSKTGVAVAAGWQDSGDFTADASVTRGQIMAAVMRYASGTSITARVMSNSVSGFAYTVLNQGSDTKSNSVSTFGIRYSDGSYAPIPFSIPVATITTGAYASNTNPNHRGAVWTTPLSSRCIGGWVHIAVTTDFDFIIATDAWDGTADNDGTSNLQIINDKDQVPSSTGTQSYFFLSSASLSFSAGSKYRAIMKPTSVTSGSMLGDYTMNAAALMDQMELGQAFQYTTANNPTGSGSWTDTATRYPVIGFWMDQLDDGTSALICGLLVMP